MPAPAAQVGFDALWLEAEHNTWDRREIPRLVALHHLANIDGVVRTGSRNANELYHLLEDGVTALMIPLLNTPEDAAHLAAAVNFPPLGERGLDGASLDNNFYLDAGDKYPESANAETSLIVQIKTPEALANLDAIAGTPPRHSVGLEPPADDRRGRRGRGGSLETWHCMGAPGRKCGSDRPVRSLALNAGWPRASRPVGVGGSRLPPSLPCPPLRVARFPRST